MFKNERDQQRGKTGKTWQKPVVKHWGDIRISTAGSDIGAPEAGGTKIKDKPNP